MKKEDKKEKPISPEDQWQLILIGRLDEYTSRLKQFQMEKLTYVIALLTLVIALGSFVTVFMMSETVQTPTLTTRLSPYLLMVGYFITFFIIWRVLKNYEKREGPIRQAIEEILNKLK